MLPFSKKLPRGLVKAGRDMAPVVRPLPWGPQLGPAAAASSPPLPPYLCPLQYVWDRMLGGFKHKNFRTREGTCLCLVATLNA